MLFSISYCRGRFFRPAVNNIVRKRDWRPVPYIILADILLPMFDTDSIILFDITIRIRRDPHKTKLPLPESRGNTFPFCISLYFFTECKY